MIRLATPRACLLTLFLSCATNTPATGTSTAGVLCDFNQNVYNESASVKKTSSASWSCSSTERSLKANGIPDHQVGAFPNANNPNTISEQTVAATFTLTPLATSTVSTLGGPRGAVGYVLNGVKIDPDTGGACDDSGATCDLGRPVGNWRMEALGQTSFNFGADMNNAHVQPNGEYHYHGIPEGFVEKLNKGQAMTLIGWAADGFPIYVRYGYATASDSQSAVVAMKPSYRIKATPDANRPATSLYAMGTFKQDWEYVAGLGDLDECNGRTGVTPEFPKGIYHYFATDAYPFLQRCVKGQVTAGGGGPGMPPMPP
jgi:YHYH protein